MMKNSTDLKHTMFLLGSDNKIIFQLFSKRNKLLIANGAKQIQVQIPNEKDTPSAVISRILALKEAPYKVALDWFREHHSRPAKKSVLNAVKAMTEKSPEERRATDTKQLWEVIFSEYLFNDDIKEIQDFLSSETRQNSKAVTKKVSVTSDGDEASQSIVSPDLLQHLKGMSNIETLDHRGLSTLALMHAARFGATKNNQFLSRLESKFPKVHERTQTLIGTLEEALLNSDSRNEALFVEGEYAESRVYENLESLQVLAKVTKITTNGETFFATALGVVDDDKFFILKPSAAERLFPLRGDLFGHFSKIQHKLEEGQMAFFRAVEIYTDKPNKYEATELLHAVSEVVRVPHISDEPDLVRTWLTENSPRGKFIYQLEDGLYILPPTGNNWLAHHKFDKPLKAFTKLSGYKLGNTRLITFPLPATNQTYSCPHVETRLSWALKAAQKYTGAENMTRNIAATLLSLMSDDPLHEEIDNLELLTQQLDSLIDTQESVMEFQNKLIAFPEIKNLIEREKIDYKEKLATEFENEAKQLQEVKEEIIKYKEDLKTINDDVKIAEKSLAKQIKRTYESASEDGIKFLSKIALYEPFLRKDEGKEKGKGIEPVVELSYKDFGRAIESPTMLVASLLTLSDRSGMQENAIFGITCNLLANGLAISIGPQVNLLAATLNKTLCGGCSCSVSATPDVFSLSDLLNLPATITTTSSTFCLPLGSYLLARTQANTYTVVEIVGANRCPVETFLPELKALYSGLPHAKSLGWRSQDGSTQCLADIRQVSFLLRPVAGTSTFPMFFSADECDTAVFHTDALGVVENVNRTLSSCDVSHINSALINSEAMNEATAHVGFSRIRAINTMLGDHVANDYSALIFSEWRTPPTEDTSTLSAEYEKLRTTTFSTSEKMGLIK